MGVACSWNPFPPIGFPHPALMLGFMPCLIALVMQCLFDTTGRKTENSGSGGEGSWGRTGRRLDSGWDVLYERGIKKNK